MPPLKPSDQSIFRIQRLRELSSHASPELQTELARFACVLLSGFIENRVEEILSDFIERKGSHSIVRRAAERRARIQAPDFMKIKSRIEEYSPEWEKRMKLDILPEQTSAIDAVVGIRNSVAHGGNASITWQNLDDYELRVKIALGQIRSIVDS
jgi:hypothetical protein